MHVTLANKPLSCHPTDLMVPLSSWERQLGSDLHTGASQPLSQRRLEQGAAMEGRNNSILLEHSQVCPGFAIPLNQHEHP